MKVYLIIKTERFEVSEDKETVMYALTNKDKVEEDIKHLKKDNDNNRVSFGYKEIYVANQGFAVFSKAEMLCGLNRVKWAEGLISQLSPKHEGRNSWLLNFGIGEESVDLRKSRDIKFDDNTQSAVYESIVSSPKDENVIPNDEILSAVLGFKVTNTVLSTDGILCFFKDGVETRLAYADYLAFKADYDKMYNACKTVVDQLTETVNLTIGDEYYCIKSPFKKFEVIKSKPSAYYLAYCDGSCSDIEYVSKSTSVATFNQKWFKTSIEAYEAKLNKNIKETAREKEFLKELKEREDERRRAKLVAHIVANEKSF